MPIKTGNQGSLMKTAIQVIMVKMECALMNLRNNQAQSVTEDFDSF